MRCHRHRHRRRLIAPSNIGEGWWRCRERRHQEGGHKYVDLQQTYMFVPLDFETLGPINIKGVEFLQEMGHQRRQPSDFILVPAHLHHAAAVQRYHVR